ncbi:hypothetical protein [Alistipes sp.]|uniref:hypothetical protein n=1 Tax=Alistipes sp. TaxID=1872444 RepID=UPI0025BA94D4|nr:hypothetical protein [Alistipes sp.]
MLLRSEIISENKEGNKSGWIAHDFTSDKGFFNAVESGLALNAMPTPYARAEVVKQAFESMLFSGGFGQAGYAYQQLVSDTLDILEILFNYELYQDVIRIEHSTIDALKKGLPLSNTVIDNNNRIISESLLGRALDTCKLAEDIYFVIYEDQGRSLTLAMSSPQTLFVTSSRLDRNIDSRNEYDLKLPRRNSNGAYFFQDPVPVCDRERIFQDYLYHMLCIYRGIWSQTALGAFLDREFGGGRTDSFDSKTVEPLYDSARAEVRIPLGLKNAGELRLLRNNRPQAAALINDYAVSVGFNLNKDRFLTIPDKEDVLLPLNLASLSRVGDPGIVDGIRMEYNRVTMGDYSHDLKSEIKKVELPAFDMGVYPFFRYPEEYVTERVVTYNVILAYEFKNRLPEDAFELTFYRQNAGNIEPLWIYTRDEYKDRTQGAKIGVVREIRTDEKSAGLNLRTIHYSVVGSNFDYIQVKYKVGDTERSGVLKPKFEVPLTNDKEMCFAVDFGTTSTFVAACTGDEAPTALTTADESMVFLHGNHDPNNHSKIHRYVQYANAANEREKALARLVPLIRSEFIPSSIDGETYRFPTRTAVSCSKTKLPEDIFEDANIAFTYDREQSRGDNRYTTDIKWSSENNLCTRLYIRELIRICVIHAIGKGCRKGKVQFRYFYPLAMTRDTLNEIHDVWEEGCKEFGLSGCTKSMTESLAPYYAVDKRNAECVVSIDIGGGSVDIAVFRDSKPQFAMSSLFGCDVLWGSGRGVESNDKSNPLYRRLKDTMTKRVKEKNNPELETINEAITADGEKYSSVEIMNFWLTNEETFRVSAELRKSENTPIYIGHFYALLYHIAQTMKFKGMAIPVEITLSGNGSKYLGYIRRELPIIAVAAFGDVYGEQPASISVTLPDDGHFAGKEMTAYGGLRSRKMQYFIEGEIENFIYLGARTDVDNQKCLDAVDELVIRNSTLQEELVNSICANVIAMQNGFKKLLNKFKCDCSGFESTEKEYRTDLKEVVEHLASGKLYVKGKRVYSTLFFIPVRHMIFKLEEAIQRND